MEKPAHIQRSRFEEIGKRYDVTLIPDGSELTGSGLGCGAENPRFGSSVDATATVSERVCGKSRPGGSHSAWEQRPSHLHSRSVPPWSQFAQHSPAYGCQRPGEPTGRSTNVYTHQPHEAPRRCLIHPVRQTSAANMASN